MILDVAAFIAKERPRWDELDAACRRIEEEALYRLSVDEVRTFYTLYRRAVSGLSILQEAYANPSHIGELEQIVARAYGIIYSQRSAPGKGPGWIGWFFHDFPRVFRRHFALFALSLFITLLGCGLGVYLVHADPSVKQSILPFGHGDTDPKQRVAEEESGARGTAHGQKGTFSAFLMRNNISVALRAIAFGCTLGIGTLLLLLYNGIMLGGICLDYVAAGKSAFLAGWLLPHGSIEIPAILIAGQAGFLIAGAVIGLRGGTFRMRMRAIGRDLTVLAGGIAVMLVWAGFIESFFSQYHAPVLPYWLKITFGALELAGLTLFLALGGRKARMNER
jgi:uncharacterized membrane protein SpoIIM required for sporulation